MNVCRDSDKLLVLVKYGGNAMVNEDVQREVAENILLLRNRGADVVVVHGGGPFIARLLELAGVDSEFIDGHRKTTPETLRYVEMALKGEVNGKMVSLFNGVGLPAVGLSGKDGGMVVAKKRRHLTHHDGTTLERDLGRVGDVDHIDPSLIQGLLDTGYLPIITCIATGEDGLDYNINADLFAGHLAGSLRADFFVVLTDVDGVMRDMGDPNTRISAMSVTEIAELSPDVIHGGMIPKLDSCRIAVIGGAGVAYIVNGTKPHSILDAVFEKGTTGTQIHG